MVRLPTCKNVEWLNAKQKKLDYPDTFYCPDDESLDSIKVNSVVKVATYQERFWVVVSKVDEEIIQGYVNNDLVYTKKHGLICGRLVELRKCNVLDIY